MNIIDRLTLEQCKEDMLRKLLLFVSERDVPKDSLQSATSAEIRQSAYQCETEIQIVTIVDSWFKYTEEKVY